MKLILSFLFVFSTYDLGFSQEGFELLSKKAVQSYPGIPSAPVKLANTYIFICTGNDVELKTFSSDGFSEETIDITKVTEGDTVLIQFNSYSFDYMEPGEGQVIEDVEPEIVKFKKGTVGVTFTDYNTDAIQKKAYGVAYYMDGQRYDFEFPEIEEVERIYYP